MTEEKENNTNIYININRVASAKGLKSNRSLRLEINKPESKYIAREVKVNGGTSYEILYSSLEPEIQQKLKENSTQSTALVPLNYQPTTFVSESARLTCLLRFLRENHPPYLSLNFCKSQNWKPQLDFHHSLRDNHPLYLHQFFYNVHLDFCRALIQDNQETRLRHLNQRLN